MYKDLLDYCFDGKYSAAIADKKAAEKETTDVRARADREKMALKMKLKEVDPPTISVYTGLSIEEIEQL
jgi:hypothetical protein